MFCQFVGHDLQDTGPYSTGPWTCSTGPWTMSYRNLDHILPGNWYVLRFRELWVTRRWTIFYRAVDMFYQFVGHDLQDPGLYSNGPWTCSTDSWAMIYKTLNHILPDREHALPVCGPWVTGLSTIFYGTVNMSFQFVGHDSQEPWTYSSGPWYHKFLIL